MEHAAPRWIGCLDVETTGLSPTDDRIVSFAFVAFDTTTLGTSPPVVARAYLIFNPARKNHPEAERIHGFDDWTLAHQQAFSIYAERLAVFLGRADLIVGHNIAFDLGFVDAELARCGLPPVGVPSFCTMQALEKSVGHRPSLSQACQLMNVGRQSATHSALEDAWLAGGLYRALRGAPDYFPFSLLEPATPLNWIEPPPHPKRAAERKPHGEISAVHLVAEPGPTDALFRRFSASRVATAWGTDVFEEIGIVYLAGSDPAARRVVEVWSITTADGAPTAVVGHCRLCNTRRQFKIDKIGGLFDPSTGADLSAATLKGRPRAER